MKKLVFMVCVLILVIGSGLFAVGKTDDQVAKKAKKAYESALSLIKEKQFPKVEEKLNEALQLEPDWAPPYATRGWLLLRQNPPKLEEAKQNFEKALTLRPEIINTVAADYARILYNYGASAYQKQQFADSNGFYAKILDIPSFEATDVKLYIMTLNMAGTNYTALNNYDKAEACFKKLIGLTEAKPELADFNGYGQFGMGKALSMEKKYEAANPYLAKFIEMNKGKANMAQFVTLAAYFCGSNNYEALKLKTDAITAEPPSAEVKAKIEQLEAQKAKLAKGPNAAKNPKAIKIENDIIGVKNEDVKNKKERIAKLAQEAQVEPLLTGAIQGMPDLEAAYVKLANYYYLSANLEKAIETYKKVIEKFPASPDLTAYKKFLEPLEKEKADSVKK